MGYLPGKWPVPASTDEASQTFLGGERSPSRAFRVGHAEECDGGERHDAAPVRVLPGCAGDGVLRGGLGGRGRGRDNDTSTLVEASNRALHRCDARFTLAVKPYTLKPKP